LIVIALIAAFLSAVLLLATGGLLFIYLAQRQSRARAARRRERSRHHRHRMGR
jgi:uncharacterized protein (DUF2062 family)